jgi:hypothetical protein
MAKRRTKQQITSDKIIKKNLEILGEQIYEETKKITRVQTGSLKNSINYAVKPDTRLTVFQNVYGKYITPKDEKGGEKDALLITVKRLLPAGVEVIKKDLFESIMYPFRK